MYLTYFGKAFGRRRVGTFFLAVCENKRAEVDGVLVRKGNIKHMNRASVVDKVATMNLIYGCIIVVLTFYKKHTVSRRDRNFAVGPTRVTLGDLFTTVRFFIPSCCVLCYRPDRYFEMKDMNLGGRATNNLSFTHK